MGYGVEKLRIGRGLRAYPKLSPAFLVLGLERISILGHDLLNEHQGRQAVVSVAPIRGQSKLPKLVGIHVEIVGLKETNRRPDNAQVGIEAFPQVLFHRFYRELETQAVSLHHVFPGSPGAEPGEEKTDQKHQERGPVFESISIIRLAHRFLQRVRSRRPTV